MELISVEKTTRCQHPGVSRVMCRPSPSVTSSIKFSRFAKTVIVPSTSTSNWGRGLATPSAFGLSLVAICNGRRQRVLTGLSTVQLALLPLPLGFLLVLSSFEIREHRVSSWVVALAIIAPRKIHCTIGHHAQRTRANSTPLHTRALDQLPGCASGGCALLLG
jgi:hypothetical protein